MQQRFILVLVLLLVACPHANPASSVSPGIEAGASDCNLDSGVVVVPTMEAHFTPGDGCQAPVIAHIKSAKKSIFVQAYPLTARPIIEALVGASASGVTVQVILDAAEAKLTTNYIAGLRAGNIKVFLDPKHVAAHNKVMVFDETSVESGSYGFTNSSEYDTAENCFFTDDLATVKAYEDNWKTHQAHSTVAP